MIEKLNKYLPYATVVALSLAIGAILAGLNAEYTRGLATWLTMTFAGIGLYIGINKYGFDLEEISKKDLRVLACVKKDISYRDRNGGRTSSEAYIQEIKNDSDMHAQLLIPGGFDASVLVKLDDNSSGFTLIWDGHEKTRQNNDPELLQIRSGKIREIAFIQHSTNSLTMEYYYGDNTRKTQYLYIYLLA